MDPADNGPASPEPENVAAQLAARSTESDLRPPPEPLPSGGLWRLVDLAGPFAAWGAALLALLALLAGFVGGPDFAWAAILYLPVTLLLLLYIPYLLRRRRQEKAAQYYRSLEEQEQARLEIARQVLEAARCTPDEGPHRQG